MKHEDFRPTETESFWDGTTEVKVHVQNDDHCHAWQIEVNGDKSLPTTYYPGILEHKGYIYVTAYWEGKLPIEQPLRVMTLTRI